MPRPTPSYWFTHRFSAVGENALAALAITLSVGVSLVGAQTLPTDANPTCTVPTAMFNSWFAPNPPLPNGVVNPGDSLNFPDNPNCSFYQWSWQMFLWLTSPAPATYGGGGGRIFASPAFYTVSPPDPTGNRNLIPNQAGGLLRLNLRAAQVGVHGLPVIMSKSGQMFEVQPGPVSKAGKPFVLNRAGKQVKVASMIMKDEKLVLLDQKGKPIQAPKLIIQNTIPPAQLKTIAPHMEEVQPVPQHERVTLPVARAEQLRKIVIAPVSSALVAQKFMVNGRLIFLNTLGGVIDVEQGQADFNVLETQTGSLIYYVTMVNDVYAYFATGTKNGGITPMPTHFPTTASDLAKIVNFASSAPPPHNKTFPDPNALAVEVKSAWIEATGLTDPSKYITTEAIIPTYDKTTNPMEWVPNGQKTTTVALVGMHVVGSTKGHPEMIWATFEHFGNTPNEQYNYNSSTGPNPKNVPRDTSGSWLFCSTGASTGFNQAKMFMSGAHIKANSAAGIVPSDTIREKPFGTALNVSSNPVDSSDAEANTEIIAIDNSVASQMPSGDVRNNYFMTGATWTIFGGPFKLTGPGNFGNFGNPGNNFIASGIGVGTSQIANTTMETFQQITTSWNQTANNCFSCHNGNTLPVSHVFCDPAHSQNGCTAGIQPLF